MEAVPVEIVSDYIFDAAINYRLAATIPVYQVIFHFTAFHFTAFHFTAFHFNAPFYLLSFIRRCDDSVLI
jgi:hypothetical protein